MSDTVLQMLVDAVGRLEHRMDRLVTAQEEFRVELTGFRADMDAVRADMDGVRGDMDGVRGELRELRGTQDTLATALDRLQTSHDRLRVDVMGRLDRLQDTVADIKNDITVNLASSDIARDMAESARTHSRGLEKQMSAMEIQIRRLQTRVDNLESRL